MSLLQSMHVYKQMITQGLIKWRFLLKAFLNKTLEKMFFFSVYFSNIPNLSYSKNNSHFESWLFMYVFVTLLDVFCS